MILTKDQENALQAIDDLVADPNQKAIILSGSAGTGKSTLLKEVIHHVNKAYKTMSKLLNEAPIKLVLTATTNKAANSLMVATKQETFTTSSALGLKVDRGKLVSNYSKVLTRTLLVVDEFSYAGDDLIDFVFKRTDKSCKIVFIGDECQLPPVGSKRIPVMELGLPIYRLTQQVRQETGTLKTLGEDFKEFVKTGVFPEIDPDDESLVYYDDPEAFSDALLASNQGRHSTMFISFSNDRGKEVNEYLHESLTGKRGFSEGDVVVLNSFLRTYEKGSGKLISLPTDSTLTLMSVSNNYLSLLYPKEGDPLQIVGTYATATTGLHDVTLFCPDNLEDYTYLKGNRDLLGSSAYKYVENYWADLRHLYACTVHKSQGSTYDEVFIDLTDFSKIRDTNLMARLLYVALTRARKKVHLIGDI